MGRDRFVEPNAVKLPLSDDDFVEVKERLSYGDEQRLSASLMGRVTAGSFAKVEDIPLEPERFGVDRLLIWIVDWSFKRGGKAVPVSREAIAALDPDTVAEIDDALAEHIAGIEAGKKAVPVPIRRKRTS